MRRRWIIDAAVILALAPLLALAACTTVPIRTMGNGAAGEEQWLLPVPTWPSLSAPSLPDLPNPLAVCD